MTDPRLDDRDDDNGWSWLPGVILIVLVVGGLAVWAYSSGDLERTASRTNPDATTGQGIRPPVYPNPARPAPYPPQR